MVDVKVSCAGITENKKKNNSIEFFRFFFMLILAIWHFEYINFFKHGYLVVEFYFILSGFLLYKSFLDNNVGTMQYTIKKIKRFWPEYIFAFLLMYMINLYFMRNDFEASIDYIFKNVICIIPELLLIQDMGIFARGFNYPLWYLSILIVGGGLLYGMLNASKRLVINVVLPFLVILVYTYLLKDKSVLENWNTIGCFYLPLLRGMADMSIGILVYHVYVNIHLTKYRILFNLISISCLIFFLLLMFTSQSYDQYVIIFIPTVVMSCMVSGTWINKIFHSPFWTKCGGISFEMYLIHAPIISIYSACVKYDIINNRVVVFVCYLTTLILGSILLKYVHGRFVKQGIPLFV